LTNRCGLLQANRIVINKGRREMLLLRGESVLRAYRIALGPDPAGHKQREGDGRTPEGAYCIDRRNPRSAYHLSLHISYPNETDRAVAEEAGDSPGGDIMIHGAPNDGRGVCGDWTRGCIGVSNAEMDEIWSLVADGTLVEILP
jgi:murein L,D-transpeptidase YafK